MVLSFYMVSEGKSLRAFLFSLGLRLLFRQRPEHLCYITTRDGLAERFRCRYMALSAMDIWCLYFHLFKVSKGAVTLQSIILCFLLYHYS